MSSSKLFEKIFIFAKAQVSSLIGGLTDYSIMVFFTEVFHVHYTISIAIGGIIGAIVNFSLNRAWTFRSKELRYESSFNKQLLKFVLVVLNSIFLKSSGTYLITTFLKIDYKISRIIVDLLVSIGLNYTLQRYWVFKNIKWLNRVCSVMETSKFGKSKLQIVMDLSKWTENSPPFLTFFCIFAGSYTLF